MAFLRFKSYSPHPGLGPEHFPPLLQTNPDLLVNMAVKSFGGRHEELGRTFFLVLVFVVGASCFKELI